IRRSLVGVTASTPVPCVVSFRYLTSTNTISPAGSRAMMSSSANRQCQLRSTIVQPLFARYSPARASPWRPTPTVESGAPCPAEPRPPTFPPARATCLALATPCRSLALSAAARGTLRPACPAHAAVVPGRRANLATHGGQGGDVRTRQRAEESPSRLWIG